MDGQREWQSIRSQLADKTKDLSAKEKFAINDLIYNRAKQIMEIKSLSLIYDEYGNQIYEKTSDIKNYINCKKTGSTFLLFQDETKLVETTNKNDEFNTDFIAYDSINDVYEDDVKYGMDIDSDFVVQNDNHLYLEQERTERKQRVFNDGIQKIKSYINIDGFKDFQKVKKDLFLFVK